MAPVAAMLAVGAGEGWAEEADLALKAHDVGKVGSFSPPRATVPASTLVQSASVTTPPALSVAVALDEPVARWRSKATDPDDDRAPRRDKIPTWRPSG